jgi:hypothetical protein
MMVLKVYGRNLSCVLSYHPYICLEGLGTTTKDIGKNRLSPGRNLNPGPLEYKAGVLITRPHVLYVLASAVKDIYGFYCRSVSVYFYLQFI